MVIIDHQYTSKMKNITSKTFRIISIDHCYARPWNWKPESEFLRPTKTLFITKEPNISSQDDENIDVETEPEVTPLPVYDVERTKIKMDECEKYAFSSRFDRRDENWEEKISKFNWSARQSRIFTQMVSILNSLQLAKLSQCGVKNEPILRQTVIDKASQRVRKLMTIIAWDTKITQWLHQILIDHLDAHYLSCYLDILQTLKAKLPTFVDKMMQGSNSLMRLGPLNNSNLLTVLEKQWDSIVPIEKEKPTKLPGNPVIVIIPIVPITTKTTQKWVQLFSQLGTVVTVPINFGNLMKLSTAHYLDQLFSVTRGKIQDLKDEDPERNVILVGFKATATLALQVAQVEPVMCVISMGFSLLTANGTRGDPDDNLLDIQCPVLFVIGQRSNTSLQEDIEDLRERMRVETGLIIIGATDDYLRICKGKKRSEGITQKFVDRCIMEEVGDFINGVILSQNIRQQPEVVTTKKGNFERSRYSSNASSLDSEPPSPAPHLRTIHRPVGRPPLSKNKSRADNVTNTSLGSNQIKSNQNRSPSPSLSTPTPDTSSNDSYLPEKQPVPAYKIAEPPVKKIKTLKPIIAAKKNIQSVATLPHPISLSTGSKLCSLLQSGVKMVPPAPPKISNSIQSKTSTSVQPKTSSSGIKVLENVAIDSTTTAKLIKGRNLEMTKGKMNTPLKSGTASKVIIMPDGRIRTIPETAVKRKKIIPPKPQVTPSTVLKPPIYLPTTPKIVKQPTTLGPPANLTTQDIMDLPIIFADDDALLNTNVTLHQTITKPIPITLATSTPKIITTIAANTKFMLLNKQGTQGNLITGIRRPINIPLNILNKTPVSQKFTKIVMPKKKETLPIKTEENQLLNKSAPSALESIDYEDEIKATTLLRDQDNPLIIKKSLVTKSVEHANEVNEGEGDDPDYIPSKKKKTLVI